MSIESNIDKFLEFFGVFERQIEKRKISDQITDRRDRIALFAIYLIRCQEE